MSRIRERLPIYAEILVLILAISACLRKDPVRFSVRSKTRTYVLAEFVGEVVGLNRAYFSMTLLVEDELLEGG